MHQTVCSSNDQINHHHYITLWWLKVLFCCCTATENNYCGSQGWSVSFPARRGKKWCSECGTSRTTVVAGHLCPIPCLLPIEDGKSNHTVYLCMGRSNSNSSSDWHKCGCLFSKDTSHTAPTNMHMKELFVCRRKHPYDSFMLFISLVNNSSLLAPWMAQSCLQSHC